MRDPIETNYNTRSVVDPTCKHNIMFLKWSIASPIYYQGPGFNQDQVRVVYIIVISTSSNHAKQ